MPDYLDGPSFGRLLQTMRRHNGVTVHDLALSLACQSGPDCNALVTSWHDWIVAAEQGQLSTVEPLMVVAVALTLHVPISAFFPSPMAAAPEEPLLAQGSSLTNGSGKSSAS